MFAFKRFSRLLHTVSGSIEAHQAWNVIAERSPGALQQICWSFNMTPPLLGIVGPPGPPG